MLENSIFKPYVLGRESGREREGEGQSGRVTEIGKADEMYEELHHFERHQVFKPYKRERVGEGQRERERKTD